jgi:hypothetical protein
LWRSLAIGGVVDLHDLAGASECDELLVGAEIGSEHGVGFIADGGEAFAGLDLKENDAAGLHRFAACDHQNAAIKAEADDVGLTFGEGECAEFLLRGGIEQTNVLITCDGDQRSAWTRGHGDDGQRALEFRWCEGGQ